jgi:FtsH-binding integral membrane protein
MTESTLPHGELPPIPDGSGILPVAENRIARGPHPELLDAVPEGFAPLVTDAASSTSVLNDAMEQTYRRVLARALALASAALLLTSGLAASLIHSPAFDEGFFISRVAVRLVLISQVLFIAYCSRYVEKLGMVSAGALLFGYSALSALEFSLILPPSILAVVFFCAGLMYACTALWGYASGCNLAHPAAALFMIPGGGVILYAVNKLLGTRQITWVLSAGAIVIFGGLVAYYAEQICDFYQDFDDDNAQGWKASVIGALLLVINLVGVFQLFSSFLGRDLDHDSTDDLPR